MHSFPYPYPMYYGPFPTPQPAYTTPPPPSPVPEAQKTRQYTTVQEKIEAILELLHKWRWTRSRDEKRKQHQRDFRLSLTRRVYTCGADDRQHCGARNSHQLLDPGIPIGTGARLEIWMTMQKVSIMIPVVP